MSIKSIKSLFIILAASIAALGTIPYSYRFAMNLPITHHHLAVFIGVFLAIVGVLANTALCAYSLLNLDFKYKPVHPLILFLLSVLSAIPSCFTSFFGYKSVLPLLLNLFIAIVVLISNTAIGYTAMTNFITGMSGLKKNPPAKPELYVRKIGIGVGFFISLIIYVVSTIGIAHLLRLVMHDHELVLHLSFFLGIFTWLPYSALFCHSVQVAGAELYHYFRKLSWLRHLTIIDALILLITLGAGASSSEVAIEFFNPHNAIPEFFKIATMQTVIYYILVPMAFITAMAVSSLSLHSILHRLTVRNLK